MPYNDPEEMLHMSEHPEGISRDGLRVVGQRVPKIDAVKLVLGRPAFADDLHLPGMLYGKLLLSPYAHARIARIDASRARALPGVHAVLTYQDIRPVRFTTAGQSHPLPSPLDTVSLDSKVRFVGDRVAAVAAETPEITEEALRLIDVEYEVLPAVLEIEDALKPSAPIIHDEPDCSAHIPNSFFPERNIAAHFEAAVGNLEAGFAAADFIVEREYRVPQVTHVLPEPHVCITWWDEDGRLVIRTATQVPFHVRRILAPVLGLPVKRIRVIKPRIGGGFGGKQEIVLEDICAHLTIATGRPVRMMFTREEEFLAGRTRHPQIIRLKTGVRGDGTITAMDLSILASTGAYGAHALTVQGNSGAKALALYRCPNQRFAFDAVYTNHPVAGAMRGYGAPQGLFALEVQMDEIAAQLGMDPIEFRRRNWVRVGDIFPLAEALGEGRKGIPMPLRSSGLAKCVELGAEAIRWERGRQQSASGTRVRGVGMAALIHGSGIPGIDMGGAYIKMNDDGSFNLLVGATDLGTGSDTVLAQIAAEVLGCRVDDILVYAADTDMTPFDKGAYASSTTFVSGGAVKKAAAEVARQIKKVAGDIMEANPETLYLADGKVIAPSGESVTLAEVALRSLHVYDQHQIMGSASHMSVMWSPPFAAQFAEVEVDTETGEVRVLKLVTALDCGQPINPDGVEGQIDGGVHMSLGYGLSEEMVYDEAGRLVNPRIGDYHVFMADEMPEMVRIIVPTNDPAGPFGAKAAAEIPTDGVAPAIVNAIYNASGIWLREIPLTPERVWRALQATSR
ncbi:MAG TPA: xanthine dehydrogenase [Anaerolineae bacterium]|nr:xanthine dehydrogenase [Anaerolineae bacterium]HIQ06413.1 xanthine dehydrogenase [Anaerolineae bacterium]